MAAAIISTMGVIGLLICFLCFLLISFSSIVFNIPIIAFLRVAFVIVAFRRLFVRRGIAIIGGLRARLIRLTRKIIRQLVASSVLVLWRVGVARRDLERWPIRPGGRQVHVHIWNERAIWLIWLVGTIVSIVSLVLVLVERIIRKLRPLKLAWLTERTVIKIVILPTWLVLL